MQKKYFLFILGLILSSSIFLSKQALAKDLDSIMTEIKADPVLGSSPAVLELFDESLMCATRLTNDRSYLSRLSSVSSEQAKIDIYNHASAFYVFYKKYGNKPMEGQVVTGLPPELSYKIINLLESNKDKEAIDALVKFGSSIENARKNVEMVKAVIKDKLDGQLVVLAPLSSAIKSGDINSCEKINNRPCRINCYWYFSENSEDACVTYLVALVKNSSRISASDKTKLIKILSK